LGFCRTVKLKKKGKKKSCKPTGLGFEAPKLFKERHAAGVVSRGINMGGENSNSQMRGIEKERRSDQVKNKVQGGLTMTWARDFG